MSYEPTNWKSGDVVTSAKLNKLEQGVAGAGGIFWITGTVDETAGTQTLDKTYNQIVAAIEDECLPVIYTQLSDAVQIGLVSFAYIEDGLYSVRHSGAVNAFQSDSPDGVLTLQG